MNDEPAAATAVLDDLPFDEHDEEWAVARSTRGIRLRLPVVALVALMLVAAGFWGGAVVQKSHGSSGSSAGAGGLAARLAAGGARPGGATGAAAAPGTTGTISVVDGSTLYVLTSSGSLVKVTLDGSTAVTRNAKASQAGLRPGDTVVVQGATAKNGAVTATSVAATAAGVTTAGGGFGRGFGGGGASGATGG